MSESSHSRSRFKRSSSKELVQEKYTIIRNPWSHLFLDGSQTLVLLQPHTGFNSQLWALEHAEHGRFYIHNREKGQVLDVQHGAKAGTYVILRNKERGNIYQQWYINSDGTIVHAGHDKFALDVGKHHRVVVNVKTASKSQVFKFTEP